MIFGVVALSKVMMSTRHDRPTLATFSDNGVPSELYVVLMRDTLKEKVEDLIRWDERNVIQSSCWTRSI